MKPRNQWFRHPVNGFMLIARDLDGLDAVVTALCLDVADLQQTERLWHAHKNRLRVNGGCGSVCITWEDIGFRQNPAFKRCRPSTVPTWIRRDFEIAAGIAEQKPCQAQEL